MNIFIKISAFLFLSIAFSGCLDMTTKVILKPDGSGTIEETTLTTEEAIKMLSAFAEDSTGDDFEVYSEEELLKKAKSFGEGVKFVSAEEVEGDGKRGMKAIFSFEDISKLNIEGYAENEAEKLDDENEAIKFAFAKGNPSTLEIIMPKPQTSPEDGAEQSEETTVDSSSAAFMEGMKETLSQIKMAILLEFDGKITDSDATYKDGNEITLFRLNFKKIISDPEAFERLKYSQPKTLTEIREMLKDVAGVQIETKEKIFVKFQ